MQSCAGLRAATAPKALAPDTTDHRLSLAPIDEQRRARIAPTLPMSGFGRKRNVGFPEDRPRKRLFPAKQVRNTTRGNSHLPDPPMTDALSIIVVVRSVEVVRRMRDRAPPGGFRSLAYRRAPAGLPPADRSADAAYNRPQLRQPLSSGAAVAARIW